MQLETDNYKEGIWSIAGSRYTGSEHQPYIMPDNEKELPSSRRCQYWQRLMTQLVKPISLRVIQTESIDADAHE